MHCGFSMRHIRAATALLAPILLIGLSTITMRCSSSNITQTAGGTGSEVEGRVAAAGGRPSAHTIVHLRSQTYLNPQYSDSFNLDTLSIADAITDSDGRFSFSGVRPGAYFIEATNEVDSGVLIPLIVPDSAADIQLETAALQQTGTLRGRINLPMTDDTGRAWVLVHGLERAVFSSTRQTFEISNLPAGHYNILLWMRGERPLGVYVMDTIRIVPNAVFDMGVLNFSLFSFFQGCRSYECDSQAVRLILDNAGLFNTAVAAVTRRDAVDGRITALTVRSAGISSLDPNIGSLSRLRSLELTGNLLSFLPPEIGYCANLCTLRLDSNRLALLPRELAYCDSLKYLSAAGNILNTVDSSLVTLPLSWIDLGNNNIGSLSAKMTSITTLDSLNVHGNKLCAVPVPIRQWLDTLQPDWRLYQRCNLLYKKLN